MRVSMNHVLYALVIGYLMLTVVFGLVTLQAVVDTLKDWWKKR